MCVCVVHCYGQAFHSFQFTLMLFVQQGTTLHLFIVWYNKNISFLSNNRFLWNWKDMTILLYIHWHCENFKLKFLAIPLTTIAYYSGYGSENFVLSHKQWSLSNENNVPQKVINFSYLHPLTLSCYLETKENKLWLALFCALSKEQ